MQKQKIDADIENGKYERVYLIYGDEPYLVKHYKNRLKKAIIPEDESMNYAFFDSMPENITSITSFADTMPFFGDKRLVMLDKATAFKKDTGLADYIPQIPETTTIIIVEEDVDKRTKLFKAIQKYGCITELKKVGLADIKLMLATRIKRAGKGITERDCEYLISCVGDDLNTLYNEVDKCIAYAGDAVGIDRKIINEVCSMQVENKIFDMVDAILAHNGDVVYKLYGDLLTLRENAFGIMAVIRKNYSRLLMISELSEDGCSVSEIAARTKTADWLVKKQLSKVRGFNPKRLKDSIECIVDTEYSIKAGNIGEQLGLEIMLAKLMTL